MQPENNTRELKAIESTEIKMRFNAVLNYFLLDEDYPKQKSERVPFYYLVEQRKYLMIFNLYYVDRHGNPQAEMILADSVEDIQKFYQKVKKDGFSYFTNAIV